MTIKPFQAFITGVLTATLFAIIIIVASASAAKAETFPATLEQVVYAQSTIQTDVGMIYVVDDKRRGVVCYIRPERSAAPSCVKYR